ncbi:MAG: M24 family metallopeptidase [Sarcina sp.]
MNNSRIDKVIEVMKRENLSQMLVTSTPALFYLTGKMIHAGERMLALYINVNGDKKFVVNKLFPVEDCGDIELVWYDDIEDGVEVLSKFTDKSEILGIDKDWRAHFLIRLMDLKGASGFVNSSPIIDKLRMVKDDIEKELMIEASKVNDEVMSEIVNCINDDTTEKDICRVITEKYAQKGTQGNSFPSIVAYGANAADPHCSSGDNKVKAGDCIVIDMGCRKDNYCSDMTRTYFYKEVSDRHADIYNIVLEANKRAIATVKAGARFCDVDNAARDYITEKGYGEYFTHRTGHCIGIEVHDFGNVSSVNEDILEEGMIFSVEPGIYIKDDIGVRIEDLVMVTKDGCKRLNEYNKELTIIK